MSVIRDRFVRSWPERKEPLRDDDVAHVVPLGFALDRDYTTDAHFTAYSSPNGHRLNCDAFDHGLSVAMTCVVFDVDAPGHEKKFIADPWRLDLRERVLRLNNVHPGAFFYETKGGARLVYQQEHPMVLRSRDDAREWSQAYLVAVAHLGNEFGIEADPACSDWQRLYRLPHATREPQQGPENWPRYHHTDNIGALEIEATHADLDKATHKKPKVFRPAPKLTFIGGGGDGLLFRLLRLRGDVGKDAARGGWICNCPNRAAHTSDTDGTDSTVVYPAAYEKEIGAIHCLHAHCAGIAPIDWLKFFSDVEIDRARQLAAA